VIRFFEEDWGDRERRSNDEAEPVVGGVVGDVWLGAVGPGL
jgi:hypothetical protein